MDRLWTERPAEQETWEGGTGPERLTEAFEAFDAGGITARENFARCRNRGTAEKAGERGEEARGFVCFHTQCAKSVAAGYGPGLLHGGFDGSAETTAAVGREVVARSALPGCPHSGTAPPAPRSA